MLRTIRTRVMRVSPQETRRNAKQRCSRGAALLQARASVGAGAAVGPHGEHAQENAEAEHYQQGARGDHRREEGKGFWHVGSPGVAAPLGERAPDPEKIDRKGTNPLPVVQKSGRCRGGG